MEAIVATNSNRDAILDATDRLMARLGFRKMSMEDVAREAGLSRRTIYTYFKNKEELGLSSISRVVESVFDSLQEWVESEADPELMLHEMLRIRVMRRIEAVQAYYESLDELFEAVRPAYMERRARAFIAECEVIATAILAGIDEGRFQVDDVPMAARSLVLATNAFIPYSLPVRELGKPEEIEQRLNAMIDLLIRGLRAPRH